MRNEREVMAEIQKVTDDNRAVLDCGPATVQVNAVRAGQQLAALVKLDSLYWVLGKERPKFKADDYEKVNT